MEKNKEEKLTKYEIARILGARALQIAMNAPLLIKISKEELEKLKYDALKIAEVEFESGILPISVKRPFPPKKEEKLKRIKEQQISDEKIEEKKSEEEEDIAKSGEIMELVGSDEEILEESEEELEEE
ncbi:MAG: DNA-directed RNA polymerase subunit K [Candidatus Pacearchaeota archaeon]